MYSLTCWWVQEEFLSSVGVYVTQAKFLQIVFQVLLHCKRREFFLIEKDFLLGASRRDSRLTEQMK